MVLRLLILLVITLAVVALWGGLRLWRGFKLRRLRSRAPFGDMLPAGMPAVVAFSSPYCRDCHTLQDPALTRLEHELSGRVTIKTLSALEYPELVDELGILTVPSTVVLDASGEVRYLNLGYTSDAKLREQMTQTA